MQEEQGSTVHTAQIQLYNLINGAKPTCDLLQEMAWHMAELLDVERVSVWRFSRRYEELRMIGSYQRMVEGSVGSMAIPIEESTEFLEAAHSEQAIVADDVAASPLTAELLKDHWTVFQISSAIFVPLHNNERTIGGVIYEHTGNNRRWKMPEIKAAVQLAVPVGLVLQSLEQEENKKQLAAIQEIQALFSGGFDLFSLLDVFLEKCVGLTQADGARAFLLESDNRMMRCVAASETQQEAIGKIQAWGVGPVGEAAETGRPLVVPDYHTWASSNQADSEEEMCSVLCIPILWRDELTGVVQVFIQDSSRALGWIDLDLLIPLVQQMAVVIQDDRLLDTNLRLLNLADELHEIGIAAEAASDYQDLLNSTLELACRANVVDIGICELEGQVATWGYSKRSGQAIAEHFRETGLEIPGATWVDDWKSPPDEAVEIARDMLRFDLRSSLAVPLNIAGHPQGMLILAMKQPRVWRHEEVEWLENAVNLIGAAVERIRAALLIQDQSVHLQILETTSDGLNRSLSYNDVLNAVGEGIMTLGKSYRGAVIMHQSNGEIYIPWMNGLTRDYVNHILSQVPSADSSRLFDLHGPAMLTGEPISPREAKLRNVLQADSFHTIGIWPMLHDERIIAIAVCFYDSAPYLSSTDHEVMRIFLRQASAALENARLYEQLQNHYLQAALALANTINDFEDGTADRSREMAEMARKVGQLLGLTDWDIEAIYWAALTHDVGKTGIPGKLLRKHSPLNDEDWSALKKIPLEGEKRLLPIPALRRAGRIVRHMHERFDGSGYPDGLTGEQIPLGSRILSVVDAYLAMTIERPYRPVRSHEEAVSEIRRSAGTQFDPHVVEAFLQTASNVPDFHSRRN